MRQFKFDQSCFGLQTNIALNVSFVRSECALSSPGSQHFCAYQDRGLSLKGSRRYRRHFGVSKTIEVFSRDRQDTAGGDTAQISAVKEE